MAGKTEVGETGSESNNLEQQKKKDDAIQNLSFFQCKFVEREGRKKTHYLKENIKHYTD